MRKLIFLTTFSVMLLGGSYATFAQGGGGEKPPEVAKPRPVHPRETEPTRPPVSVAPARPIRPALSAMVITTNVSDTTIALNGRKAGATNSNNALFID